MSAAEANPGASPPRDNRLKHGGSAPRSLSGARESYEEALRLAVADGLEERIRLLVEARLADPERLEAGALQQPAE